MNRSTVYHSIEGNPYVMAVTQFRKAVLVFATGHVTSSLNITLTCNQVPQLTKIIDF